MHSFGLGVEELYLFFRPLESGRKLHLVPILILRVMGDLIWMFSRAISRLGNILGSYHSLFAALLSPVLLISSRGKNHHTERLCVPMHFLQTARRTPFEINNVQRNVTVTLRNVHK